MLWTRGRAQQNADAVLCISRQRHEPLIFITMLIGGHSLKRARDVLVPSPSSNIVRAILPQPHNRSLPGTGSWKQEATMVKTKPCPPPCSSIGNDSMLLTSESMRVTAEAEQPAAELLQMSTDGAITEENVDPNLVSSISYQQSSNYIRTSSSHTMTNV